MKSTSKLKKVIIDLYNSGELEKCIKMKYEPALFISKKYYNHEIDSAIKTDDNFKSFIEFYDTLDKVPLIPLIMSIESPMFLKSIILALNN